MTAPVAFSSMVELPDGRRITVTIEVPEGHPSLTRGDDVLDHTEYVQMGAAHALRTLRSGDRHRAGREADAEEVPF